ncbi:tudor domain-containing protein 1 [Varanus komodoensis]|uniref:tudor domain-containing protein 1 n=1 Tax=Varanus komodoensis TaxID=61221 RepID=UPI001CF77D69|nr:tudor domain-containing protein 1 [Varanus komodoensis]
MDLHKMAQMLHIRNKETKIPKESVRCSRTVPNIRSSLLEGKTPALLNNFSICDQTKLFVSNRDSGLTESNHDGCPDGSNKKVINSNMNGGELKGNLETKFGAGNLLSSSAKEMQPVSGFGLIHGKQRGLQSAPVLNSDPLNLSHLPACHFCGLLGSLRCTQCKQIYYCSLDCQQKDWQMHSIVCKPAKLNTDNVEDNAKTFDETKKKENMLSTNTNKIKEQDEKREEQANRVMFSDLNTLGVKKSMKIEGTITEFHNPDEFFVLVNSSEVLSNITKLIVKLKDYSGVNQDEYVPVRGEVGVAKYSVDQNWYRALIEEVDIIKKNAWVLYIDYGNRENVPLNKIKQLHKEISHVPPCAIKCCVANVLLAKQGWNANYHNAIAPVLTGKYCLLTIVDVLVGEMMPYFAVDAVLPDCGKHLHEILMEMGHVWNSKGMNIKEENSATGSTMEKNPIQAKKDECKGLDHRSYQTLKVISLSIGDVFLGVVAHIQTPGDFFCQQMGNGCKLSELQISLHEYCGKVSATPDFCPAIGDMCCAQFTEDNQWYRASVLAYISDKTALVGYVDYGNVEVLHLSKLRPIIPELVELPVQAIKCTLAGVKPTSGTWSTEATSVMKQLMQNKVATIKIMDKKENTFVVEISDESVSPIRNVSEYLVKSGCAVEETTTGLTGLDTCIGTPQKENDQKLERVDWSWVTLTAEQVVNVTVCVLYNPSEFYCHLLNNDDLNALKELNASLTEFCKKIAPNVSKLTVGELCCAYFSGDGRWYRALVKDATSFEAFKVQFVDYGNCQEVTLDKVRQLSSSFLKLPFQAIRCRLSGVRPINEEWTPEATASLQMLTAGKTLQARVISLTENGAEVELIDNSSSSPVMISDILIHEKLGLKKEILSDQKMPPNELAANHFQEMSTCIQWTSTELPVDKTVNVRALHVIHPGLFYVVPIKVKGKDKKKFHKLMTELTDYCNSQKDSTFKPKVGELCCAKFSGDNNWYRAVVLENRVSKAKVAYADYGNVEILPCSRLLPIIAPYLELPVQILKCSLAGITSLDGKWSLSATQKVKCLLLNEAVTITVKRVDGDIHAVTAKINGDRGILDVADQLVTESMAKYCSSGNQCSKQSPCCCTELRKQVVKLEQIINFLLKDRFGEDKLPEIIKSLEE